MTTPAKALAKMRNNMRLIENGMVKEKCWIGSVSYIGHVSSGTRDTPSVLFKTKKAAHDAGWDRPIRVIVTIEKEIQSKKIKKVKP